MPTDNYIAKIRQLQDAGALPRVGVGQVEVFHDDWCGVFAGLPCDCAPDVRLKWAQPSAAQN